MDVDRPLAGLSTRGLVAVAATFAYGLAAVVLPYVRVGVTPGLIDLTVGWALMGSGLALLDHGPRRAAALLVGSGISWFALDFSPLLPSPVRGLLDATSLLYVALLAHAVFLVPRGRFASRLSAGAATIVYGVAIAAATGYYRVGLIIAGVAVLFAAVAAWNQARVRLAPSTLAAFAAGVSLGAGLFVTSVLRLLPSATTEPVLARAFNTATVAAAVLVLISGSAQSISGSEVDLTAEGDQALENVLGTVLGVPRLSVAFLIDELTWIDSAGRPIAAPHSSAFAVRDGESVIAMLDVATEVPSDIEGPLRDLLRLVGAHARLQRDLRARLTELDDSRRRLVEAGDLERRQLEVQLRRGALARVEAIDTILGGDAAYASLRERVATTRLELDRVARGLDPLADRELNAALRDLAARSPLNVRVETIGSVVSDQVGRAVWFTCAEALANTAKHAGDATVSIKVTSTDASVIAIIADDGPGGADPSGSGLRGLADRAGALGGTFDVTSAGCGTRIVMTLPRTYGPTRSEIEG